jgi:hypothetical protein
MEKGPKPTRLQFLHSGAIRAREEAAGLFGKVIPPCSSAPNDDVGTHIDSGAGFDLEDWSGGGVDERTASGAIRYVRSDYDDYYREIPG